MNVTAKDKKTNKEASITIKGSSNLKEEEINRMVKEAEENKEKDAKAKEIVEIKYRAESLISNFENSLKDEKAKNIPEDQKATVQKQIDELKDLLKNEKYEELKQRIDSIEAAAAQFAQQANKDSSNQSNDSKDENNQQNKQ